VQFSFPPWRAETAGIADSISCRRDRLSVPWIARELSSKQIGSKPRRIHGFWLFSVSFTRKAIQIWISPSWSWSRFGRR